MSRTYGSAELNRASRTWLLAVGADAAVRAKRVFPRISPGAQGVLPLADTPANCEELRWFESRFPLEMSEQDRAHMIARAESKVAEALLVDKILAAGYAPQTFPMLKPLRKYQALAVEIALQTRGLLVADDLGLGKTVTLLGLLTDPRTLPALVVCPTQLQSQWQAKIAEFLGSGVLAHIIEKMSPYDLVAKCGRIPDVVITNYAKIASWAQHLCEGMQVKTALYDEVQHFRHTDTKKYEAAMYLRDRTEFRCGASGTPIYNYGNEIHAVMSVLRDDCLGTPEEFGREWCGGSTGKKAKVEDSQALNTHLRREGLMVRRRKADVGRELPALSSIVHVIDSDGRALADCEVGMSALAEAICAEGGSGFDKMQASAEFDLKLRQLTGIEKAPYVAAFVRMLASENARILVFAWHREVYSVLLEKLGPGQLDEDGDEEEDLHPLLFTGSENAKQKTASIDRFVSGDCRVLLMSLRSGEGIDGLQAVCSTVVFSELDWSPSVMSQCAGRVHRDGQQHPVFSYILVANEGSDPIVADILDIKSGQFEGLFNAAPGVEDKEVPIDRVKQLAAGYLAQQKGKKALAAQAPPPNPAANAPAQLKPAMAPQPAPARPAPPPPKPAPSRWVTLRRGHLDADIRSMLLSAGVGVTSNDLDLIMQGTHRARVGFHGGSTVVAFKIEPL